MNLAGEKRAGLHGRLFRYDRQIAINTARATFAKWRDRLIAATMLLAALASMRSWLADRSWTMAAWAGLGAGVIVGLAAGRLIAARLAFHVSDGPLAADALRSATRRRYMIAWYAIGLAMLAAVTLVARPSLLIASLPGYLIGALVGHGTGGFVAQGMATGNARFVRTIRSWLQRPRAGLVGAAILLASLPLPARSLGADALIAVAGIEAAILALALTIVDDSIVRFMTIGGHGSRRIIAHQARGATLFVGVAAPVCFFAFSPILAGVVAAVSTAALLLMTLRILAYRLHGKRVADLLVSILAALCFQVAYSMPVILPLIAIAILWQLQRRAAAKTWMLE